MNDVVSLTKQYAIVNLNWDESTTNSKGVFSFYYDPVMDRGDKKNMDFLLAIPYLAIVIVGLVYM